MTTHSGYRNANTQVSLLDLLSFFLTGWKVIIFCVVLFGVLALVLSALLPEKFEASVSIGPAKAYQGPDHDTELDSPQALAMRMKEPSYYSRSTVEECTSEAGASGYQKLASALDPQVLSRSPFVSVSYRASSPEQAKRCLNAVVVDVVAQQQTMLQPIVEQMNKRLSGMRGELASLKLDSVTAGAEADTKVAHSVEMATASTLINAFKLMIATTTAHELQKRISQLEFGLQPPNTQSAQVIAPVYSSGIAVFPRTKLFFALGLALGLMVGLAYLLLRHAIANLRASRF